MSARFSKSGLDQLFERMFEQKAPRSYILGVRGATPSTAGGNALELTENRINYNDDAVGIATPEGVMLYPGTIEPGHSAYHVNFYSCKKGGRGLFHIEDGLHFAYKGLHQKKYAAFRITNAKGWRDCDVDGYLGPNDKRNCVVPEGINIHKGGAGDTVGRNSEGCLNIKQQYWAQFKDLGYAVLPNKGIAVWVIEGRKLFDAINVTQIQVFLNNTLIDQRVPCWVNSDGRTVIAARSFLTMLQVGGQDVLFDFKAPNKLVFSAPVEGQIRLHLKGGRGFAGLRDVVEMLDKQAEIQPDLDSRKIVIKSQKIKVVSRALDTTDEPN